MTIEEAISHLMNDWYISNDGKLVVDTEERNKFMEAIGVAINALDYSKENQKMCQTCMWVSRFGSCTCEDSKYNGFLMRPGDKCDKWGMRFIGL